MMSPITRADAILSFRRQSISSAFARFVSSNSNFSSDVLLGRQAREEAPSHTRAQHACILPAERAFENATGRMETRQSRCNIAAAQGGVHNKLSE